MNLTKKTKNLNYVPILVCSRFGREFELVWYVVNLSQTAGGGGGGKLRARKIEN